jgi:antitoxin MazE
MDADGGVKRRHSWGVRDFDPLWIHGLGIFGLSKEHTPSSDGMALSRCGSSRCLTCQPFWNNIVITVRAVHVSIRQIGNSQGIVIPKPILAQLGLDVEEGAEMTIEDGALVLRRPASPARTGWAEAARRIAEAGDDELVMGEFGNAEDSELAW